jgi:hypothetical protein
LFNVSFDGQYCFEILIFVQQPNKFTWVGVVLVLGSLVVIGIEKVKQSQAEDLLSKRIKHRSSDLPSGGADDTSSLVESRTTTIMGKARNDEETPELMVVNGNDPGKAE